MKSPVSFSYRLLDSNKYLNYNAYAGTALGILGVIISVISISTSVSSLMAGVRGFGWGIIFTIFLVLIGGAILKNIFQENLKIATKFEDLYNQNNPLSEDEIKLIPREGLSQTKLYQLNRIPLTNSNILYWQSSWFGSGNINVDSNEKISLIESVIIKYADIGEFYGKIPIIDTKFDNESTDIKALKLKFVHFKSGFWCAAIHGVKGLPSNTFWERSTIDLSITKCLHFYARAIEVIQGPPQKNAYQNVVIKNDPSIYVRLEDKNRNSSDGVIISVPSMWKKFEIPISKFIMNFDLEEDYHEYLKEYIFKEKEIFNKTEMMQVLIGCSEKMPDQAATVLIYDLKFI